MRETRYGNFIDDDNLSWDEDYLRDIKDRAEVEWEFDDDLIVYSLNYWFRRF